MLNVKFKFKFKHAFKMLNLNLISGMRQLKSRASWREEFEAWVEASVVEVRAGVRVWFRPVDAKS